MINGKQETKLVITPAYSYSAGNMPANFTSAITSNAELYTVLPQVAIGNSSTTRVGDTIRPTSLTVKGFVALDVTNDSSACVYADIFFLTHKSIKCVDFAGNPDVRQLLRYAQSSAENTDYDGSSYHATLPINSDMYTILKRKRVKLQKASGGVNEANGGSTVDTNAISPYTRSFSVKLPVPAVLKYSDAAVSVASNYWPFMAIGFTCEDGTSPQTSLYTIRADAQCHLYYKDS